MKMNMQRISFGLKEHRLFDSDILCKHNEDTTEVAFAYFSLTLEQENQYKKENTCKWKCYSISFDI